ncbi:MAG: hypothetical protein KUA37_01180 [Desulfomicrobium sp.]|nr:hypothetical protein [Pseudomonadota bacterium]MBV1710604.1 hypothetical protein [Desulfomicrobium sp.]MBU4570212.1 hypothetical protein [Pseudomonadota bacterium]MBU4593132.1 hypothetical protein [Pseudomonadota bacterium]MBV1720384.1 hypothetical protein [Desulfomicrobium sp.]
MDKNIRKENFKENKGGMKDNWAMRDDELAEFDGELEKMSDILQEYINLKYDVDDTTLFLINTNIK